MEFNSLTFEPVRYFETVNAQVQKYEKNEMEFVDIAHHRRVS